MNTIINTPPSRTGDEGSGAGFMIGVLLVIIVGFVLFVYGLPLLRATEEKQPQVQKIEIQVPTAAPAVSVTPSEEPVE